MHLLLVLPRLLTLPATLLRAEPSLAQLAARAAAPQPVIGGLDAAQLAQAGADPSATAACAALGAGAKTLARDAYVLRADPVSLIAGRDDVLLAGRVDDLSVADAAALIDALNAHFAVDRLHFFAPRSDAWFLTAPESLRVATTALAEVDGALLPHLPQGAQATTWRRWLSEMQMLLHAHPVNAAREQAGQVAVTGIWISGGGTLAAPTVLQRWFAPAGAVGDVARGLALAGGTAAAATPAAFALLPTTEDCVAVLPPVATEVALAATLADWVEPALFALTRRDLASLTLVADDGRNAWCWRALAPTVWQRVAQVWRSAEFAIPAA